MTPSTQAGPLPELLQALENIFGGHVTSCLEENICGKG